MKGRPNQVAAAGESPAAERPPDPWELVWGQPYIDASRLARAIELDLGGDAEPDFRTRLLVRDAATAIRSFWGGGRFDRWLAASPAGDKIRAILNEDLGEVGFPFIRRRLVDGINSAKIKRVFDLLGRNIHGRVEVNIAGSIPTLVKGMTSRPTSDINFVNEVPPEIRRQRAVLKRIEDDYGLKLTHVQSHYLPANWERRRHYLGDFGGLRVYLVDAYDVFVSKLSSRREKHKQDIRVLADVLDKRTALHRLLTDGRAFLAEPSIRPQIEETWRFVYQEPLPLPTSEGRRKGGEAGRGRTRKGGKAVDAPEPPP